MKTLILIPAYNEAKNLPGVVEELRRECPKTDLLVINDCSADETEALLPRLGVRYLNLPINLGIGGSIQAGFCYAKAHRYDCAVQIDGDGQHMARYIHDLLAPIEAGRADLVIGSRFLEGQGFQSSGARRVGIRFLSWLIHALCGIRVNDATSGMRAVNRDLIDFFAAHYAQDYPEPESILAAGLRGARIAEVPVQMRERQSGKSSITPVRSLYYMIKVTLALLLSGMK